MTSDRTLTIASPGHPAEVVEAVENGLRASISEYLYRSYKSCVDAVWEGHLKGGAEGGAIKERADCLFASSSAVSLHQPYGRYTQNGAITYVTLFAQAAYYFDSSTLPDAYEVLDYAYVHDAKSSHSLTSLEGDYPSRVDLARALVPKEPLQIARNMLMNSLLTAEPSLDVHEALSAVNGVPKKRFNIRASTLRPYNAHDFFIAVDPRARYTLPPNLVGEVLQAILAIPALSK